MRYQYLAQVVTSEGSLTCRIIISAVGALHKPRLPDIPGQDKFEGEALPPPPLCQALAGTLRSGTTRCP